MQEQRMVCSTCFSVTTTTTIFASSSLPNNNNNNSSNHNNNNSTNRPVVVPASLVSPSLPTQQYKNQPGAGMRRIKNAKQPSVAEVEKAIGAGLYRERDPRASVEEPTLFDKILTNPFGQDEGPVEKKLRETGEWILDSTEGTTRSAVMAYVSGIQQYLR